MDGVQIQTGMRVGLWNTNMTGKAENAFRCLGHYTGPNLGSHIPGSILKQELPEGTIQFKVGVLFRPDLGKRQRLETILILQEWFPAMWEYETWEKAG